MQVCELNIFLPYRSKSSKSIIETTDVGITKDEVRGKCFNMFMSTSSTYLSFANWFDSSFIESGN